MELRKMTEKRVIDWESIEREYIPAIRSLRDIGSQFGVTESAIRDRAKRYGWERNLEEKIKTKKEAMDTMEDDWRSGVISLSALSQKYNLTVPAIKKHWYELGITRAIPDRALSKDKGVKLVEVDDMGCSGFIYVIYIDSGVEKIYKIGLAKHFSSRFSAHQCSSPFDIFVSIAYFVENMRSEESILHAMFDDKRVRGEWFRLTTEDLEIIARRSYIGG